MHTPRLVAIACIVLAAAIGTASPSALASPAEDAFSDAIRRANPENAIRDYHADRALRERMYREAFSSSETRARSSPFANTIAARYPTSGSIDGVRRCTCYLPENLRGWNGGALSQGEIIDLCWRQCF